ncbi:MAG: SIMPL domain-containing protein [Saprospiraceae bacterium]|nr:SIMPL domain-containing protein [Saprospiraceae bacterium]
MKSLLPFFFSFYLITANAQVQGNFKQRAAAPDLESQDLNPYRGNAVQNNAVLNNAVRGYANEASVVDANVIEFKIDALANQLADSYTAIFNVVQLGKTAEETNAALTARLTPFFADMTTMGIKKEDIYLDMVNFLPKFEYDVSKKLFSKKTYIEIPIGFELQKNIHVRFNDPTVLDRIVEAAAKYEIYDIVKVDYFVKDTKAVYNQLRKASLDYFEEIKTAYKDLITLDSAYVVSAENTWVAYPADRYQSYQAFSSQTLDPSQRADAKIDRVDKPVSQFYQAIPANSYDIVINPEILEPCVQFSYRLLIRCTMKERKPSTTVKREKEFLLVTPNGEVKTLKID